MSDTPRRRPGRPSKPDGERHSVQLPGARFTDEEHARLQRRAARAGLRLSQWVRTHLEAATLSVPELEHSLQETLLEAGTTLNEVVHRLHTQSSEQPEGPSVFDLAELEYEVGLQRRTLQRALSGLK